MENNVFSKVDVPVLDDRAKIVNFLIQMGADNRLFDNPSPEIGKKIIDRVLWILKENGIDIQRLGELTADQLKLDVNKKRPGSEYCDVQVDPKTRQVTLVEAHDSQKRTKGFRVDEHGNVVRHVRVTNEENPEIYTYSSTYDKNGIMMKHKFKLETKGKGDTTQIWKRDEEHPFVAHVQEKHKGNTKEYYVPLNLYEMHDVTSSEKERDERGYPRNDIPIIIHGKQGVRNYYKDHERAIKSAFSGDYMFPESLANNPYHKGLKEIAIKAGILPPERLLEDPQ